MENIERKDKMSKETQEKLGKKQNILPDEREWVKNECKNLQKQDYSKLKLNGKNDCTVGAKLVKQNYLDIDEEMHENLDREREFAEVYAEWAESL